jgi:hypothetical protein
MMKAIISSSLRFRYLVLALSVVLTWFGLARLQDVAVDVFPEFAPPSVEIQTICLGLSAAEVEQLVTRKTYPPPRCPCAGLCQRGSRPAEQTGSPYEIRALLPGTAKAFTIPEGFLRAGQAYTFAIGTVAKDGIRSFGEAGFTSARAR